MRHVVGPGYIRSPLFVRSRLLDPGLFGLFFFSAVSRCGLAVSRWTPVRISFSCPFCSKVSVYRHFLVIPPPPLKEIFKFAHTAVRLNCRIILVVTVSPQWGAADAEIEVPSGENTELTRSPFKAWSRSVHSHTCYAYCQGFLPCCFLPFLSVHLHLFQNLSQIFPVLAVANTGSCVGPQNKTGHPAGCRFPCWLPMEYK